MADQRRTSLFTLALFYLALVYLVVLFHKRAAFIERTQVLSGGYASFAGDDWINWETSEYGTIAQSTHPLLRYKTWGAHRGQRFNTVEKRDKLERIEGENIEHASEVDQRMRNLPPGSMRTFYLTKPKNIGGFLDYSSGSDPIQFTNAFRLSFSFTQNGTYWKISLWLLGLGSFIALIMLFILIPLIQGNQLQYRPTLALILAGLVFFLLQLVHQLYIIVDTGPPNIFFEKLFILIYMGVLIVYLVNYFYIKALKKPYAVIIPSVLVGIWFVYQAFDIIFVRETLLYYHDLIEQICILYLYIHILGGTAIFMATRYSIRQPLAIRNFLGLVFSAFIALLGFLQYGLGITFMPTSGEHGMAMYYLMLFFPLVNAAILQLQFGKVILVVTRSIQYLVFFMVSIALYLLITQVFDYLEQENPYQRFLEFASFLVSILVLRQVYIANANKVAKYFITAQQENTQNFRTFIAKIPQYSSSRQLRKDLVDQLMSYFNADAVHIWWREDSEESGDYPDMPNEQYERIYRELTTDNQSLWSKNKEIASFRFVGRLEEVVLKSNYNLICPITVSEDLYALLMLGKKKRGVYNLADLELISQLIQQTQLTLNVIQLITREKSLIQQKYEADLMALRSQINPHFLFNTLNSLTELVHESPEMAEDAIEKLSFIFRYTTKESSKNLVPIRNEIKLVSTYLELEKIRFGERLTFHIDVKPEVMDHLVPAFVLQTLVENCIKHGIAKVLHPGIVSIKAFEEDGYMKVHVRDNGPGIDHSRIFKSTGLSNTIRRFENIYGLKNLLEFINTGEGTLVQVKVPLNELKNVT